MKHATGLFSVLLLIIVVGGTWNCAKKPTAPEDHSLQTTFISDKQADTLVEVDDTLTLWVKAENPDSVHRYYWDINGSGEWDIYSGSDTIKLVWSDTGKAVIYVALQGVSGDVYLTDSILVSIIPEGTYISNVTPDMTVEKNDSVKLWIQAKDTAFIAKYYWDLNGDNTWDHITDAETLKTIWTDTGSVTVFVAVQDTSDSIYQSISIQFSVTTTEFESCWNYLQWFSIFQDSLPDDPYVYPNSYELYKSVSDPYTVYIYPENAAGYLNAVLTTQETGKVGIKIDSVKGHFIIKHVVVNSPGEEAGLKKNDTLIAVNDSLAEDRTTSEVFGFIAGSTGDVRVLRIKRDTAFIDFTVTLGTIIAPSVFMDTLDTEIAYIQITQFTENTTDSLGTYGEFHTALEETQWAEYTLLDLRRNPGGTIGQCLNIAGEFLPEGTPVVRSRQRDVYIVNEGRDTVGTTSDSVFATGSAGIVQTRKFILLADSFSASASEILISALQYHRGFIIIGDTTFGKARGQILYTTPRAGLAKITFTLLSSMSGAEYDLVGIPPDIVSGSSYEALEEGLNYAYQQLGTAAKKQNVSDLARRTELFARQNHRPWIEPLGIFEIVNNE